MGSQFAIFLLFVGLLSIVRNAAIVEAQDAQHPIVQLKGGQVQGIEQVLDNNLKVHLFQGIRYGKAVRFEKPKPVDPWTGIFNATVHQPACPQLNPSLPQSEDCLYLNVWTPETAGSNRSVMVYIHGGGFTGGTIYPSGSHGGYLAGQGDVVMVTVGYRLGMLGFLYAGDAVQHHEGNYGLYDQILALEWVHDNIGHFGGDPTQVTIFGESAGSWSVSALILSPLAKGLFHRAIMMSGAIQWAARSAYEVLQTSSSLATEQQCTHDNLTAIVECLRSKPLDELQKSKFWNIGAPVYGEALLPVRPVDAVMEGKFNLVDLMFGNTNNEAAGAVGGVLHKAELTLAEAHQAMAQNAAFSPNGAEVADYYLAKVKADNSVVATTLMAQINDSVVQAYSDKWMVCPTTLYAEAMAKANPNNRYYAYRVMQNAGNPTASGWDAVPHASDVGLTMSGHMCKISLCPDMVRAFTNFAKTGAPGKMGTADWVEAFADKKNPQTSYMALHSDAYKMVAKQYVDVCDGFWKPWVFH